jgi:hypothetical protein
MKVLQRLPINKFISSQSERLSELEETLKSVWPSDLPYIYFFLQSPENTSQHLSEECQESAHSQTWKVHLYEEPKAIICPFHPSSLNIVIFLP